MNQLLRRCKRCNHQWQLRDPEKEPKQCPACNSPYWHTKRTRPATVRSVRPTAPDVTATQKEHDDIEDSYYKLMGRYICAAVTAAKMDYSLPTALKKLNQINPDLDAQGVFWPMIARYVDRTWAECQDAIHKEREAAREKIQ